MRLVFRALFGAFFGVMGVMLGLFCAIVGIVWLTHLGSEMNLPPNSKILQDAQGNQKLLDKKVPIILQIDVDQVIGKPLFHASMIDQALTKISKERIKGILLVINSPGGEVFETDHIYRVLKEFKERNHIPVYAFVNGLCASGAYYIACVSDQIFATPVSLIGSVGVISWPPRLNVHAVLDKWGIESKTLYAGKGKDALNPTRPWDSTEGANHQMMINFLYEKFVDIVLEGRKDLTRSRLIDQYGAAVLDPEHASQEGYIDVPDATRSSALQALTVAAEISEQEYQVVGFEYKKWWKGLVSQESLWKIFSSSPKFQYLYRP